jgi:hypothetical protein
MSQHGHSPTCGTIYDLMLAGIPSSWWFPFGGVVALIAIYCAYKLFVGVAPAAVQKVAGPRLGLVVAAVIVVVGSVYYPAQEILQYYRLKGLVESHHYSHVEGVVTAYRPYDTRPETFSVCKKSFSISPDSGGAGFKLVAMTGSPIRNGAQVEIDYIGDIIVHLEVCPASQVRCGQI